MTAANRAAARRNTAPIAAQILGLMIGGLVAAQLATLALSALLPPPPPPQYRLSDIAAALKGGALRGDGTPPLERAVLAEPPNSLSPGWEVAGPSGRALAAALGVDPADVRLLFYSPPPFAGGVQRRADASEGAPRIVEASLFAPLMFAPPPGGAPGGGGPGGGWGGAPNGAGQDGQGFPTGRGRAGGGGGPAGGGAPNTAGRGGSPGGSPTAPQVFDAPITPIARGAPDGGLYGAGSAGGMGERTAGGRPSIATAPLGDGPIPTAPRGAPAAGFGGPATLIERAPPSLALTPEAPASVTNVDPPVSIASLRPPAARPADAPLAAGSMTLTPVVAANQPGPSAAPAPANAAPSRGPGAVAATAMLAPPVESTLFGLARTPVVEGEFLAALRVAPHRWVTVRPLHTPMFSRWQRRLALWFLLAFAAVAPVGYLLARRLSAPLAELADTADRLGRDPSTPVPQTAGAPEIRRLATALAGMQTRLERHVADRTAMVGAVSHDLRTPLARLRFKLERAPPALKASMIGDLGQMEEMLNAVLLFIRDDSQPGPRELADLRSIVECVVDDAALVGGAASLAPGDDAAPVEVDILSVQRVLTNLVDNALKYGGSAEVSLQAGDGEAVVRVADRGPGLDEDERERVFQPFYRSEEGRRVSAQGIGLGLSVSRSIARAHGGDIVLRPGDPGLVAELRLPLARAAAPRQVAEALAPAA